MTSNFTRRLGIFLLLVVFHYRFTHVRADDEVLVRELISREFSIHIGGIQTPDIKEVVSREVSLFILNGPADPYHEVVSREVSLVNTTPEPPPPVTGVIATPSAAGDQVELNWSAYDQWAVRDVDHFDIYLSDRPFTSVVGMPRYTNAPGESTSITLTGLPILRDHFLAIVAVDGLGNSNPAVTYFGAYVLSPQAVSREVSLFIGQEPEPPYRQIVSREVSLLISTPEPPPAIVGLRTTHSPTGDSVTLDWSAYNQWAVRDVDRYDIFYSNHPFTSVAGMPRYTWAPGETFSLTLGGLSTWQDHFFAVVPVDGEGHRVAEVNYAGAYILMGELVSREVSLFIGAEPEPPYREVVSREVSIVVPNAEIPAPVTGVDTGFSVTTSLIRPRALTVDWSTYPEVSQRDVRRYRVYVANSYFDNVETGMDVTRYPDVTNGEQRLTLDGLQSDTIYYVAVVAEDALGNFDPLVRSFSAITTPKLEMAIPDQALFTGDNFSYQLEVTEVDLTGYDLTFELVSGPPGMAVSPTGGLIWPSTAAQVPGNYPIEVRVTDNGLPPVSAVDTFTVTVYGFPDYTITTTGGVIEITDTAGNGDILNLSEPASGSLQFAAAGRTFRVNGGAPLTGTSGPLSSSGITQITVNAEAGADTLNVGAFLNPLPSLTINGGTGDDALNFLGDLTFSPGAHLDVDLQNDAATPGFDSVNLAPNASLRVFGAGTMTVKTSRSVVLELGSRLESVDGSLTVEANQQTTPTPGDFPGIHLKGLVRATGIGAVTVKGRGGDADAGSQFGVWVHGGQVAGGTSEPLLIAGAGGSGIGADNRGVQLDNSASLSSSGSDVEVRGVEGTGAGSMALQMESSASISTLAHGGAITLIGNSMILGPSTSVSAPVLRSVTLRPFTSAVSIDLGTATDIASGPLSLSDAELNRITAGTLLIGDLQSGPFTVSAPISPAHAAVLHLVSGNTLADTHTAGTDVTVASLITRGILSPGASPGHFSVAGDHTLGANSTLSLEIGGPVPGTQHDQLSATGRVDIGDNVTLTAVPFGGFVPGPGQSFTLVSRTGGSGVFAGLDEGAILANFLGSGLPAIISYSGGTGDDVVLTVPAPDIAVEQTLGTGLEDDGPDLDFGIVTLGSSSLGTTFTIRNAGNAALSGLAITQVGANSGDFLVSALGSTTVAPGNSTTFTVTFTPSAAGPRSSSLRIASNVGGSRNPFDLHLSGLGSYGDLAVSAPDAFATELGRNDGYFAITRVGPTTHPLTLHFTIGGSATAGVDYLPIPSPITIPSGQSSVIIPVKPLDDTLAEGTEAVTLTLTPSVEYQSSATSAIVSVVDDEDARGGLLREIYRNIAGSSLTDLLSSPKFPDLPDSTDLATDLESSNLGDNYGVRLSGLLTPPANETYTFYIAGDENSELWLSTDENPANKVLIASEPLRADLRNWTSDPNQASRGSPAANVSSPVVLTGGTRYYIEVLQKEGTGSDHVSVTWQIAGIPIPLNGAGTIGGEFLSARIPMGLSALDPVAITSGAGDLPLTISGDLFAAGAVVLWNLNGTETTLTPSSITRRQIQVTVPQSLLASSTEIQSALVSVRNPGGEVSQALSFIIGAAAVAQVDSAVAGPGQTTQVTVIPDAPAQAGATATYSNTAGTESETVTVAAYDSNPQDGTLFDVGGGFVDVQVVGADPGDSMSANFYYPTTITGSVESELVLLFYDGTAWIRVLSQGGTDPAKDTTDNLDGSISGGRFSPVFDQTSTPKLTELSGTIFGMTIAESEIAGRFIFYNQSIWDGNNAAANTADDNAIASNKAALLPGSLGTFANYTSYSRGINGIMVDILGLPSNLSASDFAFKVGNTQTPANWPIGPAPISVTRRAGAGVGGSDRVTLIWADGVIKKQWLEVTVLANANTGLLAPDLLYFGNAIGETGNTTVDAKVTSADALRVLNNITASASITSPYDHNRDGKVASADRLIVLNNLSSLQPLIPLDLRAPMALAGRNVFKAGQISPTQVSWEDGALRLGIDPSAEASSVEIWSTETLDAPSWKHLELTPTKNPYTGQWELRIPTEPSQPQRFYRLELHRDQ